MTVYVDELLAWGKSATWKYSHSCHMTADTIDELHQMAARLGLKRSWFQAHKTNPALHHYDLTASKRALAVRYGAKELTFREAGERLLAVSQRMKEEREQTQPQEQPSEVLKLPGFE